MKKKKSEQKIAVQRPGYDNDIRVGLTSHGVSSEILYFLLILNQEIVIIFWKWL